jgi:fructose-1-phosphate kinase PfkB-like protein
MQQLKDNQTRLAAMEFAAKPRKTEKVQDDEQAETDGDITYPGAPLNEQKMAELAELAKKLSRKGSK